MTTKAAQSFWNIQGIFRLKGQRPQAAAIAWGERSAGEKRAFLSKSDFSHGGLIPRRWKASYEKGDRRRGGGGHSRVEWWSFFPGKLDNSSAAKCSGQTNSQLKFRLHGEHTCISCSTTNHCAPEACASRCLYRLTGPGTRRSVAYDQPSRTISAANGETRLHRSLSWILPPERHRYRPNRPFYRPRIRAPRRCHVSTSWLIKKKNESPPSTDFNQVDDTFLIVCKGTLLQYHYLGIIIIIIT